MESTSPPEEARRRHYGDFYGIAEVESQDEGLGDDRPLVVVWGNCQAESLRVLLDGAAGAGVVDGTADRPYRTVRVPPVHELVTGDLPHLRRVLGQTRYLFSQPIRDDYRGLPLGTAQLAALLPAGGQVVRWPVLRYAGLYPFQVIVRSPEVGEPPVVPYHDVRTLLTASGEPAPPSPTAAAYRAVARASVAELVVRERRHDTVLASDLFGAAGAAAAHTVNHPGNAVLAGLAGRLAEKAGWQVEIRDPGRTLLDSIHAPLREDVLAALGVTGLPRPVWTVAGRPVADEEVRAAQTDWYAQHPAVVAAGLRRHAATVALLWNGAAE